MEENKEVKAVIYARVSSEEQAKGYSIDAQLRACRNFAQEKGWTIVGEYVDEGKSARSEDINKRPQFREMLKAASGRQFDVLVVHKLDRFSRNLMVTLRSFDELSKNSVTFISLSEQIDYTTPIGRVFLAMSGAFAQFYSDNLSQETKKGWHERREQGFYCGTLPFGAIKGKDGIPVADIQEREIAGDGPEVTVRNHEGLKIAFKLAYEGKSDREVAVAMNTAGYRTTGTHGARPFSKDTVKDMLVNRFYIGYIQNGAGGWLKARHDALVEPRIFEAVQEMRSTRRLSRETINTSARTYCLSYIARCARCGGNIRMQTNSRGRARVYCASRAAGLGCDFSGTFLDVYEKQIEWYLDNFVIPDDYQRKILEAHSKLRKAYDDVENRRKHIESSLRRLKEQYRWGHMSRDEYLKEYREAELQLRQLSPYESREDELGRLAGFLANVADAWRTASQEQRSKLARVLFDEVKLDSGGKVVAVKPRPELEPFFRISYEYHARDIGYDPGGI